MRTTIMALGLAALVTACGTASNKVATIEDRAAKASDVKKAVDPTSLYARLGGKDAITVVIDDFVANIAADKRINAFFKDVNIPRLKGLLVDQVCEATGGPCKYAGRTMKESHASLEITDAHFTALVQDLTKALDKHKVPKKEKSELLGALGSMKGDIVTAGGKGKQ